MIDTEHNRKVLEHLKDLFTGTVCDLLGLELEVEEDTIQDTRAFNFQDKMVSFLELHGSVFGYIAIICDEKDAGALAGIAEDQLDVSSRDMYGPLFMELLNTISGKIINTIVEKHPIVTITTPRLAYGTMTMSQSSSSSIVLKTKTGTFELFYATDSMGLKVIELLDKVKAQNSEMEVIQKEIRLILDSIPSGLMTIDMENKVGNEFSKVAEDIFGSDIAGKNASEVLFSTDKSQNAWTSFFKLIQNQTLAFDDLESLAPDRNDVIKSDQVIKLQYKLIPIYKPGSDEDYLKIMIIASDISYEEQLKEEAKEREDRAEFIHKVIVNKDSYINFLNEMYNCIVKLSEVSDTFSDEEILEAFRNSHTIKGNSSIYNMTPMRNESYELEDLIMKARDSVMPKNDQFKQKFKTHYEKILELFDEHVKQAEDMFGEIFDPRKFIEKNYTIQESSLNELIAMTDNPSMLSKLERIKLKRIRVFLSTYPDLVKTLAEKLDKQIQPLTITGEDTLIDPSRWSSFFAAFVHLIRNCVDHGIEDFEERAETGKPEFASISINIEEKEKGIQINVCDDGRGIDPEFIAGKALQKKIVTEEELRSMSDQDKQLLIFKPGFSTRDAVTCTSGRGVGMDAILNEVNKLYGTIEINSKPGQGSEINIYIPYVDNETVFKSSDQSNKRQFERKNLPIYADVRSEKGQHLGYIVDISIDGFRLVSSEFNFNIGQIAELNIEVNNLDDETNFVWLKMEVMNIKNNANGVYGWGCKIVSFENEADRLLYEKFLRSLFR